MSYMLYIMRCKECCAIKKILIILILSISFLTGCSDELIDIGKRELTNQLEKELNKQLDNIGKEINKKTAKKAGEITVDRVVDGDTFVSSSTGKEERYRLILVDTPETVHPNKPEQPFGKEASDYTTERLEGQTVQIEFDQQERDRYGRLLVYVWVGDELFNQTLLEEGLAQVVIFPPNTRYVDEFEAIQDIAKSEKIGMWGL